MPNWEIIRHPDLWRLIQKKKKTPHLNAVKMPFKCTVSLNDKVSKKIKEDPLLQAQLQDPCSDRFTAMIVEMSKIAMTYDAEVKRHRDAIAERGDTGAIKALAALQGVVNKQLDATANHYTVLMQRDMDKAWGTFTKKEKDYKKFKLKIAVNFALRTVGLAANAIKVSVAGPPGIVFAAQGTFKDLMITFNEVRLLFQKVDKLEREITQDLNKVKKKISEGKGKKAEVLRAFAESIFGYAGKTTKSVGKKLDFFKGILGKYEKKTHQLSKDLNTLLTEVEEMRETLPSEVVGDISKIEKEINALILDVRERGFDLENYSEFHTDMKAELKDLLEEKGLSKLNSWMDLFDTTVDVAKIATGAGLSDPASWDKVEKSLGSAMVYLTSLGKAVMRHQKDLSKGIAKVVV